MKTIKQPLLALLAAVGLIFGAASVSAQEAPQQGGGAQGQQAPQQGAGEPINVSDDEVESFVDAYMSVQTLNQEYTQKLQSVEDEEKATELQQEAQSEMESAVEEAGLSLEEYQQIANQAGQDEELRGKIEEALTARVEE